MSRSRMLPEIQLQKGGAARLRCMMRMLGHSSLTAARSGVSTGVNTAVAPLSAYKRAANVKRQIEFTLTRVVKCLSTDNNEVPVNKRQGGTVMTDQLYGYLLSHTPEHEVVVLPRVDLSLSVITLYQAWASLAGHLIRSHRSGLCACCLLLSYMAVSCVHAVLEWLNIAQLIGYMLLVAA